MFKVILRDQVSGGAPKNALIMDWQEGVPITVRDLIAERVRMEYEEVVERRGAFTMPLVSLPEKPKDPAEGIIARALKGFEKRSFLLIVDDRQLTSLDDEIRLTPTTGITFFRLLPLAGG